MVLSKRLRQIADFIPHGAHIIDVGTDHAYIPIRLLLDDPGATAVATDIRPGPLQRARTDAEYYGVSDRLTLLLGDGLAPCTPDSGDTVILAGMGGETMIGILSAAPWVKEKRLTGVTLICSIVPASFSPTRFSAGKNPVMMIMRITRMAGIIKLRYSNVGL